MHPPTGNHSPLVGCHVYMGCVCCRTVPARSSSGSRTVSSGAASAAPVTYDRYGGRARNASGGTCDAYHCFWLDSPCPRPLTCITGELIMCCYGKQPSSLPESPSKWP